MFRYIHWLVSNKSQVPPVPNHAAVSARSDSPDGGRGRLSTTTISASHSESRSSSASSSTSSSRTLVDSLDGDKFSSDDADPTRISIPELYYRCQNLSHHPTAPPLARRYLLRFLSSLLNEESEPEFRADPTCILSLPQRFDKSALKTFLDDGYRATTDRFEAYLSRRRQGGDREMFFDRPDAERWCRQSAVVKYVDGSWLQSALQSTAGLEITRAGQSYSIEAARKAARVSWQVLSEELGDGDIEKEHCAVYERLMDSLAGETTPKADEESFIYWNRDENGEIANQQPWVAAMLQLSLSISPNEFLPEMLGFNLSYEGLPLHLMITAHELKELKIDPYYFVLHISIDNSHSGHSAMALLAVTDFIESAEKLHGSAAADRLWKRVQAGYVLADSVRTTPKTFRELEAEKISPVPPPPFFAEGVPLARDKMAPLPAEGREVLESRLLQVFRAKAHAAKGLHSATPAKIGQKKVGEWLSPEGLEGEEGDKFMRILAESSMWIRPGQEAHKSRLIKECEWGGKMFGAFTNSEVALLKEWASSLPEPVDDLSSAKEASSRALPTLAELNDTCASPYRRFIEGSNVALEGEDYYASAIRPVDFSSYLRNVSSFSAWCRVAPTVYRKVLQHPHGVRGCFQINTNDFVRSLLPAQSSHTSTDIDFRRSDWKEQLVASKPQTKIDDPSQVARLLPSLFLSSALLEWMAAAGPAKLASPLGMAIVKVQRTLYGFASEDNDDDVGCAGTDDVINVQAGVWELATQLAKDANVTLDRFSKEGGDALALPALILLLNSQPTLHLPLLLGIQLACSQMLHFPLAASPLAPSSAWKAQMAQVAASSRHWAMEAIDIGAVEATKRGWEGQGDWREGVQAGFQFARRCLLV